MNRLFWRMVVALGIALALVLAARYLGWPPVHLTVE